MISRQDMSEALDDSINAAVEMVEMTPLTPKTMHLGEELHFDSDDDIKMRQLLLERFETVIPIDLSAEATCVGKIPDQEVYLLAQNRNGRIIYLVSPSPTLDV